MVLSHRPLLPVLSDPFLCVEQAEIGPLPLPSLDMLSLSLENPVGPPAGQGAILAVLMKPQGFPTAEGSE